MAAGSIVVDLLLKTGTFETDTNRAGKNLKKLQKDAEAVGRAIGVAFVGAVAGLGYLVKSSIDSADHLNDLSKQTGIAVETLGGIGFAASQAGGDLETAAAAAGKLNKSLAEAAAGNKEAAEAFKVLGISVKDLAGNTKTADKVLIELADKFSGLKDGPEKSALALRIFGKAGADMIPLLNDGGRELQANIEYFERYSGVTKEAAEAADKFNDTVGKITLITQSFGTTLSAQLLPLLQAVADEFLKSKEQGGAYQSVINGIRTAFETVVVIASDVIFVFKGVGREMGGIAAQLVALSTLDIKGFHAIGDAMKSDAAEARAELDALQKRVLQVKDSVTKLSTAADFQRGDKDTSRLLGNAPRMAAKGGKSERQTETERYLETLQKQLEKTKDLTAVEQVLADILAKRIKGLNAGDAGKAFDLAAQIDERKRLAEILKLEEEVRESIRTENIRNIEAAFSESEQLEETNRRFREQTEEIGLTREAELALNKARVSSLITLKEKDLEEKRLTDTTGVLTVALEDQIKALKERLVLLGDRKTAEDVADAMKEIAREAKAVNDALSGAFEDAFADFITGSKSAGDAFKAFANSVINEMARMAAQKAAKQIFGDGAGGGGWLQLLGKIAGFLGGFSTGNTGNTGVISVPSGYEMATGTNYVPHDNFRASLHKGEAVVPKAYNPAAGGRGVTFNIVNNGQPVTAREESRQESSQGTMINLVLDALVSDVQKGGKAHRALSSTYGLSRTGKKRA